MLRISSIRWKLGLSVGLVILLTVTITLVVQRVVIEPRWADFVEDFSLSNQGPEAAAVIARYFAQARTFPELRQVLEQISDLYKAKVFLTDQNGEVQVQSRNPEGLNPVESQIDAALGGKTVYGQVQLDGAWVAAVTTPIYTTDGQLAGTVQIIQESPPPNRPNRPSFPLTSSLLWGALAAFLVSLSIVYFLSRSITSPILTIRKAALRFSGGDLKARVAGTGSDELGELGRTFNQMAESLERTESMRRQLMANISHELRTPLATIQGYAEGMLDEVVPAEQRQEALQLILSESQRLEKIVRSVLELSRLETGQISMEVVSFDLEGELHAIERLFSLHYQEKGVSLTMTPPASPVELQSDPDRLRELLGILLENAWQYTPAGGEVRLVAKEMGREVQLSVTDDGPGIAGEDLPFIFDRFYRADKSHTRETGGAGLGLAIAKELANALGARLHVESNEGAGSCFTLTLPLEGKLNADPR